MAQLWLWYWLPRSCSALEAYPPPFLQDCAIVHIYCSVIRVAWRSVNQWHLKAGIFQSRGQVIWTKSDYLSDPRLLDKVRSCLCTLEYRDAGARRSSLRSALPCWAWCLQAPRQHSKDGIRELWWRSMYRSRFPVSAPRFYLLAPTFSGWWTPRLTVTSSRSLIGMRHISMPTSSQFRITGCGQRTRPWWRFRKEGWESLKPSGRGSIRDGIGAKSLYIRSTGLSSWQKQ